MRLLARTAAPTHSSKRSRPSARQRFHAVTSQQDRDAPLAAGTEALALLEVRALLEGRALRSLQAAALGNAHTTLTPSDLHDARFCSLKNPRSGAIQVRS